MKMYTKKLYSTRIILDKDYYRLEAMMRSVKFQHKLAEIRKDFEKMGEPLPVNGFKTVKEYHNWVNKLHTRGITENVFIYKILSVFGIDPSDKRSEKYKLGLKWRILFNKEITPITPTIGYNYIFDKKDNRPIEISVRILPWTTQEDYINYWHTIQIAKSELPHDRKRNRGWDTFYRDLELYILYLKTVSKIKHGKFNQDVKTNYRMTVSKSPLLQMQKDEEYEKIKNKYRFVKLDYDTLNKIIVRCKKIFGSLQLI